MGTFHKAAVGLFCLLSACSKSKTFDDPGPLHEKLTGSVVVAVKEVLAGPFAGDCDVRLGSKLLEIARQLDVRAADIQRIATAPPAVRRVEVGDTFFTEHDFVEGKNEWVQRVRGWADIFKYYDKIKTQPTNSLWVNLDANVRATLVDDRNRAVRGVDTGLDHAAGPLLKRFREILNDCLNASCAKMDLPSEVEALVQRNRHMREMWTAYKKSKSSREEQDNLRDLLERVSLNQRRYEFYSNEQIRRDGGELVLPLNSGELAGAESQLTEFIESVWMATGQRLKIEWSKSSLEPLFKILVDLQHPYSRAFVSWNDRIVQLYPGTNTRSIAHEIGHVLGFRDSYYTLWNENTCQYAIEQNEGDIMSSSLKGVVTEEEWKTLGDRYR